MLKNQGYVSVKEAASILDVAPNTVRAWGQQARLLSTAIQRTTIASTNETSYWNCSSKLSSPIGIRKGSPSNECMVGTSWKDGESEAIALDENLVTIGWNNLPDLTLIESREQLAELYETHFPDASKGRVSNQVGQLWAFRSRIEKGDLVVLPLKTQSAIAIGKIASDYIYSKSLGDGVKHIRKVDWIRTDIPRTAFEQDLLHSFGAFMTVCQIKRNNAKERIQSMLSGKTLAPTKQRRNWTLNKQLATRFLNISSNDSLDTVLPT